MTDDKQPTLFDLPPNSSAMTFLREKARFECEVCENCFPISELRYNSLNEITCFECWSYGAFPGDWFDLDTFDPFSLANNAAKLRAMGYGPL